MDYVASVAAVSLANFTKISGVEFIDVLLQVFVLLGGGVFLAALLNYKRTRRKDSMDAYSDLYEKVSQRCADLEATVVSRDKTIRELHDKIDGIERQFKQVGRSGESVVKKDRKRLKKIEDRMDNPQDED